MTSASGCPRLAVFTKKVIFKARTIKHSIVSMAAGRVVIEMPILGNSVTLLSLPLDVPTRMKHIFQPMSEPKDLANDIGLSASFPSLSAPNRSVPDDIITVREFPDSVLV